MYMYILSGYFSGQPADYLFMLIFNSICLVIISLFLGLMVLSPSLIFSVLYVWCQINREGIVTFWFGIQVKVYIIYIHACMQNLIV